MTLSATYERTYDRLLQLLGGKCAALPTDVCVHWPMHQPTYAGKLLVVGQALNGWMEGGPTCGLADEQTRRSLLAETRLRSESTTAFDWMRPSERARPFWRLADIAMNDLGQSLDQIAWSNLAKVSPAMGKNPTGEFLWSQHELGGQLLRQEVEELNPELVLVLSARGYTAPFLQGAGFEPAWDRRDALQFDGVLDGRRWLIVSHPGTFAYRFEASRLALVDALGRGQ
jgi:hypothetical protein